MIKFGEDMKLYNFYNVEAKILNTMIQNILTENFT